MYQYVSTEQFPSRKTYTYLSMYHLKEDTSTWFFFLDKEVPSKKGNDCAHDVIGISIPKTHFLLTIIVLCKCNFHNCKK